MRSRLGASPLVLPGIGWLALFFLVPLAIIFVVSLGTKDRFGVVQFDHLTLEHYANALSPTFLPTVWNSFRYAALTTIFSIADRVPDRVLDQPLRRAQQGAAAHPRDAARSGPAT